MFYNAYDLQEQIDDVGLTEFSKMISSYLKPAILITRESVDDNAIEIGASKFGGNPDLPANHQWAYYRNAPLTFIAQFNLADIPSITHKQSEWQQSPLFDMSKIPSIKPDFIAEEPALLPDSGMLYLFYDNTTYAYGFDEAHQVLYVPEGEHLIRTHPPDYDAEIGIQATQILPAHKMNFHKRLSIPDKKDLPTSHLVNLTDEQYWELFFDNYPSPNHHLYGYPRLVQTPLDYDYIIHSPHIKRQKVEGKYAYYYDNGEPIHFEKEADKWQFLFQIDTDVDLHPDFMWGDMGTLYICIPKASLRARKFEDCIIVMQCS